MKLLILVLGKTSSGKDTVAKYLKEEYGIEAVCSYTTRSMREYEKEGVQHYFRSKEEMAKILLEENVLAYTKFPKTGIEYCATIESVSEGISSYIVDPNGVKYFKDKVYLSDEDIDYFTVFVDLSEELIIERAQQRGDNIEDIKARLDSERDMFDEYKNSYEYDYYINNNGTLKELKSSVDAILSRELIKYKVEDLKEEAI